MTSRDATSRDWLELTWWEGSELHHPKQPLLGGSNEDGGERARGTVGTPPPLIPTSYAPSRHCRDARVCMVCLKTKAMHQIMTGKHTPLTVRGLQSSGAPVGRRARRRDREHHRQNPAVHGDHADAHPAGGTVGHSAQLPRRGFILAGEVQSSSRAAQISLLCGSVPP